MEHFDAWAATFGEVIDTMEISPDGNGLRPRSRFARFTNLPELQQMFRAFSDVQTAEMLNLPRPRLEGGKPIIVACPMSDEQHALQQELVERYDRLRSQKVDPREDNALAITTDGRKLATDARMLSATAPDFPESKVNRLVENVVAIWERPHADTRHADDLLRHGRQSHAVGLLALRGHHQEADRCRHSAPSRSPPSAMPNPTPRNRPSSRRCRQGSVRVLIGSTQKMGTGTNVQKRLVALHHLDAPWKPAEVEQREGRILRQGNENEEVAIYRYVTEGSFDAYMWQALETKARFIGQVITGDNAARRAEDIGGQELSYAEVKAIASGNPAVLTLAEADAELQRLTLLKKNHLDEQYVARRSVRDLPGTIASLSERLSNLTADQATATAHADDPITIGGRTCSREDVSAVLGGQLDALPLHRPRDDPRAARHLSRACSFGLVLHPQFPPDVYLEGAITRQSIPVARTPGATCRAQRPGTPGQRLRLRMRPRPARPRHRRVPASRLPGPPGQALPPRCLPVRTDRPARPAQGRAFRHGTGARQRTAPSVSELADQIKALKAAHNIEATPAARPAEAVIRRGTRHRPHPPPGGGNARFRPRRFSPMHPSRRGRLHLPAKSTGQASCRRRRLPRVYVRLRQHVPAWSHQTPHDVPAAPCDGAATQGPGAKSVVTPQFVAEVLNSWANPPPVGVTSRRAIGIRSKAAMCGNHQPLKFHGVVGILKPVLEAIASIIGQVCADERQRGRLGRMVAGVIEIKPCNCSGDESPVSEPDRRTIHRTGNSPS